MANFPKFSKNISLKTRIQSDGLLIFVSALWGSGFVAQRIASDSISNFSFNGIRFLLGAIFLLVLVRFRWKANREQLKWMVLAGSLLFIGSTLQQIGLKTTSAANAGFITGLYVVILPVLLYFLGKVKVHWSTWVAALVAVFGALLLSTGGEFRPAIGDLYELLGAFLWAGHVFVIGLASRKMDNIQFTIGQFGVCALYNLIFAFFLDLGQPVPPMTAMYAILYSAIFPVAMGFTLQVVGQRSAPTADAAIILSMEAVFGALFGYLFLRENLQPLQILGCFIIFGAIIFSQLRTQEEQSSVPEIPIVPEN